MRIEETDSTVEISETMILPEGNINLTLWADFFNDLVDKESRLHEQAVKMYGDKINYISTVFNGSVLTLKYARL